MLEKFAQDAPAPVGEVIDFRAHQTKSKRQAPTEKTTSTTSSTGTNESVETMQKTILTLGELISGIRTQVPAYHPLIEQDKMEERSALGKFIVQQYLNPSLIKQLNINPANVMDSINKIGTPGAEFQATGIWEAKTQNALVNLYAVAYGLIELSQTMGVKPSYAMTDLNDLGQLIPRAYTELTDDAMRTEKATAITSNLIKLIQFYRDFNQQINSKPELKSAVLGQGIVSHQPGIDREKTVSQMMKGEEEKIYQELKTNQYKGPLYQLFMLKGKDPGTPYSIAVDGNSLTDIAKFKQFLRDHAGLGFNADDPEDVKAAVNQMANNLTMRIEPQPEKGTTK